MEQLKFNTAIAVLIDLNSEMMKWPVIPRGVAETFLLMLAPFAPHVAEELWRVLGHAESLSHASLARRGTRTLTRDARLEIPVQVMGKVREPHHGARRRRPRGDRGARPWRTPRSGPASRARRSAASSIVPGKMVNIVTSS